MKYATFFLLAGVLFAIYAAVHKGLFWLLLWPAVSFALVGVAYAGAGPTVFGKRPDGRVKLLPTLLLLPYLVYMRGVWHLLRLLKREAAYDELVSGVLIGRRLLSWECPAEVETVLDLTCEFPEPRAIRSRRQYVCFPILDASIPEVEPLVDVLRDLNASAGTLFIHCAEGHGRTCIAAAVLLLIRGAARDADEAIAQVQSARPKVRLRAIQRHVVCQAAEVVHAAGEAGSTRTD